MRAQLLDAKALRHSLYPWLAVRRWPLLGRHKSWLVRYGNCGFTQAQCRLDETTLLLHCSMGACAVVLALLWDGVLLFMCPSWWETNKCQHRTTLGCALQVGTLIGTYVKMPLAVCAPAKGILTLRWWTFPSTRYPWYLVCPGSVLGCTWWSSV